MLQPWQGSSAWQTMSRGDFHLLFRYAGLWIRFRQRQKWFCNNWLRYCAHDCRTNRAIIPRVIALDDDDRTRARPRHPRHSSLAIPAPRCPFLRDIGGDKERITGGEFTTGGGMTAGGCCTGATGRGVASFCMTRNCRAELIVLVTIGTMVRQASAMHKVAKRMAAMQPVHFKPFQICRRFGMQLLNDSAMSRRFGKPAMKTSAILARPYSRPSARRRYCRPTAPTEHAYTTGAGGWE